MGAATAGEDAGSGSRPAGVAASAGENTELRASIGAMRWRWTNTFIQPPVSRRRHCSAPLVTPVNFTTRGFVVEEAERGSFRLSLEGQSLTKKERRVLGNRKRLVNYHWLKNC